MSLAMICDLVADDLDVPREKFRETFSKAIHKTQRASGIGDEDSSFNIPQISEELSRVLGVSPDTLLDE